MKRWRLLFSILIMGGLASCAALSIDNIAPPVPAEKAQLQRGRRIYLTACARCHAPEKVARYTQAEWAKIMPEMALDSKLNAADTEAVTSYVMNFAL